MNKRICYRCGGPATMIGSGPNDKVWYCFNCNEDLFEVPWKGFDNPKIEIATPLVWEGDNS